MDNSLIKDKTKYLDLTDIKNIAEYSKLETAGQIIRNGGLVLFPTETVYGLGANGLDAEAVKKIYVAKGRRSDNPLILHISDIEMLGKIAKDISDIEFKLMNAFWPGPFTIILNKTDLVPSVVAGGLDTVGVRMPSNEIARNLIKFADVPIAAPSANISGRPSGTNVKDIYQELGDRVDYIIDGGDCNIGVESTVVRVIDGVPHILRPGKITAEEIQEIAGDVVIDKHILGKLEADTKVMSPGMKYKHYSPNAHVIIVKGDFDKFASLVAEPRSERTCAVCFDGEENKISVPAYPYGHADSPEEQARELFDVLRHVDDEKMELAFVRFPSLDGVGMAVYNRLLRAAGFEVIEL